MTHKVCPTGIRLNATFDAPWRTMMRVLTGPHDDEFYSSSRLQRFDAKSWVPFGEPVTTR